MANFWKELRPPFFVSAPMEDVTDTVFRQIIIEAGKACLPAGRPDVFFTEFAHVEAILHGDTQRLRFAEIERPIVAQVWGSDPGKFFKAVQIVTEMGFDGIDINLGCPERKIIKTGACAALIGQNDLVSEIISATIEGAAGLPVSVKTRIGIKAPITEDWIGFLLTQNLAAITIHARTAAEKSEVPAHWDEIANAVSLKNKSKSKTLIIGNGDVQNILDAKCRCSDAGVDGVMIGRGIFRNLAIFNSQIPNLNPQQKLKLFEMHIRLFQYTWGESKNFAILKKFAKIYISGFAGASQLREKFMGFSSILDMENLVQSISKDGDVI